VVGLLRLEQRPRAVAVDVTHCLRRKVVPSSAAEIHAGLSALIQNAALLQKFVQACLP